MEVLDIVQSAAFKAGIISSFNPDELPDDVLKAGIVALTNEILPSINCDRTIDITVTSRMYTPTGGRIVLTPLKQPRENTIILGYSNYNTTELVNNWVAEIERLMPSLANEWPTDDFGNYTTVMVWSSECQIVYGTYNTLDILPDVNIDFPPMRVDAVLESGSRFPYTYKYRDEFEQARNFTELPGIYTTEEYDDKIVILLNGTASPKVLILPVPLQIINSDHAHPGTIRAPEKFRRYLIDCTAVSLAIVYGVSTVAAMQQQAEVSYNLLKKNKPQPMHKANVSDEIAQKLRRYPLGGKFYANI